MSNTRTVSRKAKAGAPKTANRKSRAAASKTAAASRDGSSGVDAAPRVSGRGRPKSPWQKPPGILHRLGLFGLDALEPVIVAALASEAPLLLIGAHGTAKSLLLERLSEALGVVRRHYNASLLNYDDLVGYPLPDADGKLRFVETPASIWEAEAVFLDEISRCRPDMQNRVFPIIHERCVQGIPLPKLRYRWAAMNPPPPADDLDAGLYRGSEPLDAALADRFAFVVEVPSWDALSEDDRRSIVSAKAEPVTPETAEELKRLVARTRSATQEVESALGEGLREYVCAIVGLLGQARLPLSGRRASILYRNAIAVISASRVLQSTVRIEDSLHLALSNSLPQSAEGIEVEAHVVLAAHRTAAELVAPHADAMKRRLISELSPVRRAVLASKVDGLTPAELSAYVADGLADAPPGGRHALAVHLFESGAASRLSAAVAEQAADLYSEAVVAQDVVESVDNGSLRHLAWKRVVEVLGQLPEGDRETDLVGNVLSALFAKRDLEDPKAPAHAFESWTQVRRTCEQVVP